MQTVFRLEVSRTSFTQPGQQCQLFGKREANPAALFSRSDFNLVCRHIENHNEDVSENQTVHVAAIVRWTNLRNRVGYAVSNSRGSAKSIPHIGTNGPCRAQECGNVPVSCGGIAAFAADFKN
jgi:hypothetical protein